MAWLRRGVSKALKNGKIDEQEFNMLQTLHLEEINDLCLMLVVRWQPKLDLNSKKVY